VGDLGDLTAIQRIRSRVPELSSNHLDRGHLRVARDYEVFQVCDELIDHPAQIIHPPLRDALAHLQADSRAASKLVIGEAVLALVEIFGSRFPGFQAEIIHDIDLRQQLDPVEVV
jgi:hypothetical protein